MEAKKLRAPRVTVNITKEIVDRATRKSSSRCMIADAIKEQVPGAINISVDLQTIRWSDREKGLRYSYLTPRLGQEALVRFDRGEKIPVFNFKLRGAQITTMMRGAPGKQKPAHKLGPRQVVTPPRKNGGGVRDLDVVGGRTPPKALAHQNMKREYGLRAFTLDDVVPMK